MCCKYRLSWFNGIKPHRKWRFSRILAIKGNRAKFCLNHPMGLIGPRLKTEGSYKTASVRTYVRTCVRSSSRKPLQQFFWNLAWSRTHLRPKKCTKRIFYIFRHFPSFCEKPSKMAQKWGFCHFSGVFFGPPPPPFTLPPLGQLLSLFQLGMK